MRSKFRVCIISILLFFCSTFGVPLQKSPDQSPQPLRLEIFIVEASKPILNPSSKAIQNAAKGDTSELIVIKGASGKGGLSARLREAESRGLIQILASPTFVTYPKRRISFISGITVPVQTIQNNTVTVMYRPAALQLDVMPKTDSNGTMTLDVCLHKDFPRLEFTKDSKGGVPIHTMSSIATLILRSGGTGVIGGIYQISDSETKTVRGLELLLFITAEKISI